MGKGGLRILAALAIVLFGVGMIPRPVDAAFEVRLNYWPTTVTNSRSSGQFGNWTTNFWGGDFRWTSDTAHWGFHLKYDTGNQGSWGGNYASATGGTDTMWSGDVFYAWQFAAATLRGFVGWGDMKFTSNFGASPQMLEGSGYRVGVDGQITVPNTRWAFNGSVAWYPSTSTSFSIPGFTSTSGASAADYSASVQYMWPQGWLLEGGYRWTNMDTGALAGTICPCTVRTSGPFFDLGYHW